MKIKKYFYLLVISTSFLALFYIIPVNSCSNVICEVGQVMPLIMQQKAKVENGGVLDDYFIANDEVLHGGYMTKDGKIFVAFKSGALLFLQYEGDDASKKWSCVIHPEKYQNISILKNCI